MAMSLMTSTEPNYPEPPRHPLWIGVAAARPAHDGRGADDRDGRRGRRDRGFLAGQPPADHGVMPGPLLEQCRQRTLVVIARPPSSRAQRDAVHYPGVDDVAQVG